MKSYIQFAVSQSVDLWILWTAIGIIFINNYATSYSLHDLVWFYITTFFAVLFAATLLSRNIKVILLGIILFCLAVYLLYFIHQDPNSDISTIFSLPITPFEFLTIFLLTLVPNYFYLQSDFSSIEKRSYFINRKLTIRVFAFIFPLVFASLLFTALDPQGVWSEEYILHVMVLGTLVTYFVTEILFLCRDKKR